MNQLFKKSSSTSGLFLLFAPVIFSSVFNMLWNIENFLYTFNSSEIISCIILLTIGILEIIFFIKLFKAYRMREPHVYYIVYFLGVLVALGILGNYLLKPHQLIIIFFLILLFALFSFRYQKEKFLIKDTSLTTRNNILAFLILAVIISMVGYCVNYYTSIYIHAYFISEYLIFPYFLPVLVSLMLIPWWKKKFASGALQSIFFLTGFYVIVTSLSLQLFAFYDFFQLIQLLGNYSL